VFDSEVPRLTLDDSWTISAVDVSLRFVRIGSCDDFFGGNSQLFLLFTLLYVITTASSMGGLVQYVSNCKFLMTGTYYGRDVRNNICKLQWLYLIRVERTYLVRLRRLLHFWSSGAAFVPSRPLGDSDSWARWHERASPGWHRAVSNVRCQWNTYLRAVELGAQEGCGCGELALTPR
jgi:hypothetical protein